MRAHATRTVVALSLFLMTMSACLKDRSEGGGVDAANEQIGDAVPPSSSPPKQPSETVVPDRPAATVPVAPAGSESGAVRPLVQVRQDNSALDIIVDNARLLVTDPTGRRSGLLATGRDQIREIPGSYIYLDAIDDAVTGEPDPGVTVTVGMPRPAEGEYRIIVTSDKPRTVTLTIEAFSIDGGRQQPTELPVALEASGVAAFRLYFSPAPKATPRLDRVEPP